MDNSQDTFKNELTIVHGIVYIDLSQKYMKMPVKVWVLAVNDKDVKRYVCTEAMCEFTHEFDNL